MKIEEMCVLSILNTQCYSHAKGYTLVLYVHELKVYETSFHLVQNLLSLGTLVPNSRVQHETNGDQILHTTKHTLKYALFDEMHF